MSKIIIENDIAKIIVPSKKFCETVAIIDAEDVNRVSMFTWSALRIKGGNTYLIASLPWNNKERSSVLLHRLITSFEYKIVDHVNRDTLDNRKSNLRQASQSENLSNRKIQPNNTTGFRGVSPRGEKFVATISVKSKLFYLGLYKTKELAALAYNEAAIKYRGEFAELNEISA